MANVPVIMIKGMINASRTKRFVYRKLFAVPDGGAASFAAAVENSDFFTAGDADLVDFLFLDFFLDIERPPFRIGSICQSLDVMP